MTIDVWEARTSWERARSLHARHKLFCLGHSGEVLERCPHRPGFGWLPHDDYDRHAPNISVTLQQPGWRGALLPSPIIASCRVILGDLEQLPTHRALLSINQTMPTVPGRCYSEPSRVGLQASYKGTRPGLEALLGMLGTLQTASVQHGARYCYFSARWPFLSVAQHLFPVLVGEPFLYPSASGGPNTREPIYPLVVSLDEIVAYTMVYRPDEFKLMFPRDPDWFNVSQTRPSEDLAEVVASNRRDLKASRAAWKRGKLEMKEISPAGPAALAA